MGSGFGTGIPEYVHWVLRISFALVLFAVVVVVISFLFEVNMDIPFGKSQK